jgi:hypothetical protein
LPSSLKQNHKEEGDGNYYHCLLLLYNTTIEKGDGNKLLLHFSLQQNQRYLTITMRCRLLLLFNTTTKENNGALPSSFSYFQTQQRR